VFDGRKTHFKRLSQGVGMAKDFPVSLDARIGQDAGDLPEKGVGNVFHGSFLALEVFVVFYPADGKQIDFGTLRSRFFQKIASAPKGLETVDEILGHPRKTCPKNRGGKHEDVRPGDFLGKGGVIVPDYAIAGFFAIPAVLAGLDFEIPDPEQFYLAAREGGAANETIQQKMGISPFSRASGNGDYLDHVPFDDTPILVLKSPFIAIFYNHGNGFF